MRAPTVVSISLVAVAVLLAVGLTPGRAAAQRSASSGAPLARQRVAVVRLTFEGGVPEAARDLFEQRLFEGLTAAQFKVMPGAATRQRLAAAGVDVATCRAGACLARAAAALEVAYLVVATVGERDKTYNITLELVNARGGASIGTGRERCEICGIEEATEKMGLAASALRARLDALSQTPARLIIRSRPSGAQVTVDGQNLGRTPVDHELGGGQHKLTLAAPGYDTLDRTVTAVSGVEETLDLDMVPLPTRFPYRAAGWAALAVGVAAMAGGIWALSYDGDEKSCTDDRRDPEGHCPNVHSTRALAAVLVGTGVAAGTLGGVWLYLGSMGTPRTAEGGGGATSAGVTVGGRF